jgi:hypothetical protein
MRWLQIILSPVLTIIYIVLWVDYLASLVKDYPDIAIMVGMLMVILLVLLW